MSHRLGVYFAPEHGFKEDRDYIAALQPPVVRILDPDVQQIADVHALAPHAIIAPRTWVIDDHDGQAVRSLMADPIAAGRDHAEQYRAQLNRWQREAQERGLRLPPADRMYFNSANEPNQGGTPDKIAAYCVAFLDRCTQLSIRAVAPCLGVGWPGNNGPDTPVDWSPYSNAGLEQAIKRGNHWLCLHEYFYKTGPQDGWRWWAGRHLQCPFDVPILLGEIGIDNYVDNARWQREGGNRGWQGNVDPDTYAEMIAYHIRHSDQRVVAALPFITDFRSPSWESFNTRAAHGALLARKDRMVPQTKFTVRLPHVSSSPTPATVPQLVHPVRDAQYRTVTQGFGERPDYYSRFKVDGVALKGHNGIDFGTPIGTVIAAVDGGRVVEVADDPEGYGLYVKLSHAWGESLYAHLRDQLVQVGEWANKGQYVGKSGNTGNSTGPHLHLGLRVAPFNRRDGWGGFVDPGPYLRQEQTPLPIVTREHLLTLIKAAAQEFGIEWTLLASLAMAESSWNPQAVSAAGAQGLTQIMPSTWAEWSMRIAAGNDPFDARQNLRVGAAYLRWLQQQTGGNAYKALHAYVFGIGNVQAGVTPPDEVYDYADKIVFGRDLLKAVGS